MIKSNKADITKAIKFSLIVVMGLLTKTINKWPATILAASRTDNVNGRIILLTNSITTMKGIRAYGVPKGTKCAKNLPKFKKVE